MSNIALVGYRGTGKSKVANYLSYSLGKKAISLDDEIVKKTQLSIPEIIKKHGWDYFRDIEQEICTLFSLMDNHILDTGGGIILREQNVLNLQKNSTIFLLTASIDNIARRIGKSTERPALVDGMTFIEEIEHVLTKREPLYKACADHTVDTNTNSPRQVASIIAKIISTR